MANENRLISVADCPCDGCQAKPCGHPARCVKFTIWLNKTADAVELVRCGECKHYHQYCIGKDKLPTGWGKCTLINMDIDMTIRDYCSHGEKEEYEI